MRIPYSFHNMIKDMNAEDKSKIKRKYHLLSI